MSIFVGNLPFRAEQEDIIELFASFGEVANCSLPLERDTGRKRGFAFVEMADEATEERAIEGLQGTELMGRPLRINKAEPRGSRGGGGGGYGGGERASGARGWEDRSYGGGGGGGEPSRDSFDEGRSRRRRGGGGGGESSGGDWGDYGGAEG
ncbi:RNA-binding domain RNP-1 (RNA recognition motif) containing protein [Synechococcus sp. Minos11]|uniref:RNA recognition motif domain-containing protein n=1 Tax=Synechococcus sp. Minos11 TaxID=221341 RepID=UPI001646BA1B|nr:RNA-binding protein [Synechococcus sp. Minos11]QNJ07505.1 RNA-binding domain RNP-1 (RNA recognition motif) containing protein [Synechococcus sp. Minos11]